MGDQDSGNVIQSDDRDERGATTNRQGIDLNAARRAHEGLTGRRVIVWIDSRFVDQFPVFSGIPVATAALQGGLVQMVTRGMSVALLVSDGNMSHVVQLTRVAAEPGENVRFHYTDPWGEERGSFLEPGRNLAGVRARTEGAGAYSVTSDEIGNVLVAALLEVPKGWARAQRKSYDSLPGTDLFGFFNLAEVRRGEAVQGYTPVYCKTGNFREHIDLLFLVDAEGMVSGAVLSADVDWITAGMNVTLAGDLAKSLLRTLDPEMGFLSQMTLQLAGLIAAVCRAHQPPVDLILTAMRGQLERVTEDTRARVRLSVNCDW